MNVLAVKQAYSSTGCRDKGSTAILIDVYTHTHTHTHTYISCMIIYIYIYVCVYTYIHKCVCIYVYTYIHTYTYIHICYISSWIGPYLTKRLKDQLLLVLGNATACVLHTELHHIHAHPSSRQGLHSHPDVPLCRELQGITQQVEDDLQA